MKYQTLVLLILLVGPSVQSDDPNYTEDELESLLYTVVLGTDLIMPNFKRRCIPTTLPDTEKEDKGKKKKEGPSQKKNLKKWCREEYLNLPPNDNARLRWLRNICPRKYLPN